VKSSYRAPAKTSSERMTKGPAQVATQRYRENWDEVFASRDRSLN
jgi:hypothetical protein